MNALQLLPPLTTPRLVPSVTEDDEGGNANSKSLHEQVRSSQNSIRSARGTYNITPLRQHYQQVQGQLSARSRVKSTNPPVNLGEWATSILETSPTISTASAPMSRPSLRNSGGLPSAILSLMPTEANSTSVVPCSSSPRETSWGQPPVAPVANVKASSLWLRRRSQRASLGEAHNADMLPNGKANPFAHPLVVTELETPRSIANPNVSDGSPEAGNSSSCASKRSGSNKKELWAIASTSRQFTNHALGDKENCRANCQRQHSPVAPPGSMRERGRTGNPRISSDQKRVSARMSLRLESERMPCKHVSDGRSFTAPDLGKAADGNANENSSTSMLSKIATPWDRAASMMERAREIGRKPNEQLVGSTAREISSSMQTKEAVSPMQVGANMQEQGVSRGSSKIRSSPRQSLKTSPSSFRDIQSEAAKMNEKKRVPIHARPSWNASRGLNLPRKSSPDQISETRRPSLEFNDRHHCDLQDRHVNISSIVNMDTDMPADSVGDPNCFPLLDSPISPTSEDSPSHRESCLKTAVLAKLRRKNKHAERRWGSIRSALCQGRLSNAGLDIVIDVATSPHVESDLVWQLMQKRYFVVLDDIEVLPEKWVLGERNEVDGDNPCENIPKGTWGMMKAFMMQELTISEKRRLQRRLMKNAPVVPASDNRGRLRQISSVAAALRKTSDFAGDDDDGASCISHATTMTRASYISSSKYGRNTSMYAGCTALAQRPPVLVDIIPNIPEIKEDIDKTDSLDSDDYNIPVLKLHFFGHNLDLFGVGKTMDEADEETQSGIGNSDCSSDVEMEISSIGDQEDGKQVARSSIEQTDDDDIFSRMSRGQIQQAHPKVIESGTYYYPLYPGHAPLSETFACL